MDGPQSPSVSLPTTLELLPTVTQLLDSKFEDYHLVALSMVLPFSLPRSRRRPTAAQIDAMGKKWKRELMAVAAKKGDASLSASGLYMAMVQLDKRVASIIRSSSKRSAAKAKQVAVTLSFL